jgi:hypothetical protein
VAGRRIDIACGEPMLCLCETADILVAERALRSMRTAPASVRSKPALGTPLLGRNFGK